METPANLGSDFPLNLFMVKSWDPGFEIEIQLTQVVGFNKPKEHDEHILVPGLAKISIYTHIHM